MHKVLDNICDVGELQKIYFLWRPYLRDPKDEHILELAVASKTNCIVTYNRKDFSVSEDFGVNIISPKTLLKEIAKMKNVSINQFISSAVSEKISAIITEDYILERSTRANREDFKNILKKVPKRKPLPGDEL